MKKEIVNIYLLSLFLLLETQSVVFFLKKKMETSQLLQYKAF